MMWYREDSEEEKGEGEEVSLEAGPDRALLRSHLMSSLDSNHPAEKRTVILAGPVACGCLSCSRHVSGQAGPVSLLFRSVAPHSTGTRLWSWGRQVQGLEEATSISRRIVAPEEEALRAVSLSSHRAPAHKVVRATPCSVGCVEQ